MFKPSYTVYGSLNFVLKVTWVYWTHGP